MTVWRQGSRQHAAHVVYLRAVAVGYSGLKLRILEAVARHGGHCWRANSDLAKQLGTAWASSIWRAAWELVRDGVLRIKRVLPGHRPEGVEKRYTHGTSSKYIDFKRLGCPEAVEDWRRPDTATRKGSGRSGAPQRPPPPVRPEGPPSVRPQEPPPMTRAEAVAAAEAAQIALYGHVLTPKR